SHREARPRWWRSRKRARTSDGAMALRPGRLYRPLAPGTIATLHACAGNPASGRALAGGRRVALLAAALSPADDRWPAASAGRRLIRAGCEPCQPPRHALPAGGAPHPPAASCIPGCGGRLLLCELPALFPGGGVRQRVAVRPKLRSVAQLEHVR